METQPAGSYDSYSGPQGSQCCVAHRPQPVEGPSCGKWGKAFGVGSFGPDTKEGP